MNLSKVLGFITQRHSQFPGTVFRFEHDGVVSNVEMDGPWPEELEDAMANHHLVRLMLGPTGDPALYGWEVPIVAPARFCAVCGAVQWLSPSGRCCDNGHGGADSITEAEAKEKGFDVKEATPDPQKFCRKREPETLLECMQQGYIPPLKPPGSWTDEKRQKTIQRYLAEGMELWEAINRAAWREIDDIMDAKFMACVEGEARKIAEEKA